LRFLALAHTAAARADYFVPRDAEVVFFHNGLIEEQGSYSDLLAANLGFASLIQARQQEEAVAADLPDEPSHPDRLQFVDVQDALPDYEAPSAEHTLHHETLQEAATIDSEDVPLPHRGGHPTAATAQGDAHTSHVHAEAAKTTAAAILPVAAALTL